MKIPSKNEVLAILEKTSIAKTLSSKEIDILAKSAKVISYSKGETIYKQGSSISGYPVLTKGLCKITVENDTKDIGTIISLLRAVNFIGVLSLNDDTFQATASTLCECDVVFIDRKDFTSIVTSNGKCSYAMFEYLCEYQKRFIRQLVDFGQKTIKARVASSLLSIADLIESDFINLPMSRNDLAEYSGIATGSTIRLLSDMAKEDVIILDKKTIKIKDREKLVQISKMLE